MKILRLELRAFGPFTDMALDFSDDGLQIVYGPNEAGKSSTLRALKGLLFGIPERTQDSFVHENSRLRIGGLFRHSEGAELFCLRRKGRQKTLLDSDEKEMDEALLRRFLGNVTAEIFDRMFGLTHTDLVEGGRDIIAGGGDLGESLFSAGLGGSGFRQLLQGLESEAEELFSPRGTKKIINSLVNEYADTRREVQRLALQGRDWDEHQEALAEALTKKKKLSDELLSLRSECNRLDRLLKALPSVSAYKEALEKRRAMGAVLILPPEFAADRKALSDGLSQGRAALEKARRETAGIREELEAIALPEPVLKHGGTITQLYKRLGSHEKAMADLPGLKGEMAQLRADAEALLKELAPAVTFEEAERLRLTEADRQRIGEMGSRLQSLEDELKNAGKTVGILQKRLHRAFEDERLKKELKDPTQLRDLLKRISREGDLELRLREVESELHAEEEQARLELHRLGLWTGSLEGLERLAVPSSETLERFAREFSANSSAQEKNRSQAEETRKEIARTEAHLESLQLEGNVPTEADLEAVRDRRERGWQLVLRAWLEGGVTDLEVNAFAAGEPLDRSYSRSVKEADETADRLRREAERVTRKAASLAGLKALQAEKNRLEEEQRALKESQESLSAAWTALWKDTGLAPLPPQEMRGWVGRQEALALKVGKIGSSRREAERLRESIAEHKESLLAGLSLSGETGSSREESLSSLLEKTQERVAEIEGQKTGAEAAQKNIRELEAELSRLQEEEGLLSAELTALRSRWGNALVPLGLDGTASPLVASALLSRNQAFFVKSDQISNLSSRIGAIEKDRAVFEQEVRGFSSIVAPGLIGMPVEIAVAELHDRLASAQKDSAKRGELTKRYEAAEKELHEAEQRVEEMAGRLAAMFSRAGCSTEEEIREREERSAAAVEVDEKIRVLHEQLLSYASGGTVEGLIHEAEGADMDSLPAGISRAEEMIAELEAEISGLDQTIGSERREIERMDGSAGAAAAAEKGQAILARLRDESERYLRLRMAVSVLRSGIEQYRAENQGLVLRRASELFSLLTLGSFAGLKTEYTADDRPVLAGVRSTGEIVYSGGMSEGTCDQLYLALRLASLEKHLASSEPLPFILDDILIHFDDARSEAVLKILAELAGKTQVILFTHHRHIVDLAEGVISPDLLQVSTLPQA